MKPKVTAAGERSLSYISPPCAGSSANATLGEDRRKFLKGSGALIAAAYLAPRAYSAPATTIQTAAAPKPFRIDVHHHIAPPGWVEEMKAMLSPPIAGWSLQKSLDDMDAAGVATAITSITVPGIWLGDDRQGRRFARECNDFGAKLVSDHPGRFGMFAAIPMPDAEGSLREIAYGLDVLKADGIALFTSYREKWLGDPEFDPVMEELNRRMALVYVHPDAPLCCRNLLRDLFNPAVIEYEPDTTRAIANLLFKGAINRYRNIRWIFSHGGGTIPLEVERLANAPKRFLNLAAAVPNGVMPELRRFHYDLAQASHPAALAALTRIFPISQLLWGTDFPYRHGEEYVQQHVDFGFSETDLRKIGRENALSLLPQWQQRKI